MSNLAKREMKGHGVVLDRRWNTYEGCIPGSQEVKDRVMHGLVLAAESERLAKCSQKDVMLAVYHAATLGMVPDTAEQNCHIIPYKNEAKFIMGYRGYINLAYQTGMVSSISVRLVYEADLEYGEFDVMYGTENKIKHRPYWLKHPDADSGKIIAAYCVWTTTDGTSDFYIMRKEELIKARDSSSQYTYAERNGRKNSVWHEHHEAMIRKTVIRHAAPYFPQGSGIAAMNFARAQQLDAQGEQGVSVIEDVPEEIILTEGNETVDPILEGAEYQQTEMTQEEKDEIIEAERKQ